MERPLKLKVRALAVLSKNLLDLPLHRYFVVVDASGGESVAFVVLGVEAVWKRLMTNNGDRREHDGLEDLI